MTMRFPYVRAFGKQPIVPLRGRLYRSLPIISVTLGSTAGAILLSGRLDSGADDTVFPEQLALRLGLTPTGAPTGGAKTALRANAQLWYAQVTLRVADNHEHREWPAWVAFTSAPLHMPLLGIAGFLEFFDSDFLGAQEAVELTINANYPGT